MAAPQASPGQRYQCCWEQSTCPAMLRTGGLVLSECPHPSLPSWGLKFLPYPHGDCGVYSQHFPGLGTAGPTAHPGSSGRGGMRLGCPWLHPVHRARGSSEPSTEQPWYPQCPHLGLPLPTPRSSSSLARVEAFPQAWESSQWEAGAALRT